MNNNFILFFNYKLNYIMNYWSLGYTYKETYNMGLIYGPFDEMPFLFKDFKKSGYLTSFFEDKSLWSMFNYGKKGFNSKPTDIYSRPFWIHLDKKHPKNGCINDYHKFDILLDHINDFITRANVLDVPTFSFAHYIEATHNADFTAFAAADYHIANFIIKNYNYLNDSIFIFMGDHGLRYGYASRTPTGLIDMNMPAFEIHLPHRLTKLYPHLNKLLQLNSEKITSWLDIHQVLLDISNCKLKFFFLY